MTDEDHRRLASAKKRKAPSSELEPSGSIDIRINAHRDNRQRSEKDGKVTLHDSSQSTLLGYDDSCHGEHYPWKKWPERHPRTRETSAVTTIFAPNDASIFDYPEPKNSPCRSSIIRLPSEGQLPHHLSIEDWIRSETRLGRRSESKTLGPLPRQSSLLPPKHFTLDDQVLAERNGTPRIGSSTPGNEDRCEHSVTVSGSQLGSPSYFQLQDEKNAAEIFAIPDDNNSSPGGQVPRCPELKYHIEQCWNPIMASRSSSNRAQLPISPVRVYGQSLVFGDHQGIREARYGPSE